MISLENVKKMCRDDISLIENYEFAINDTKNTWDCHHRLGLTLNGEYAHSAEELQRLGMYWNRPYFELIFLTHSDHQKLHKTGTNNPRYGKVGTMKGKHHSKSARDKLSKSHTGLKQTKETIEKRVKSLKGKTRTESQKDNIRKAVSGEFGLKYYAKYGYTSRTNPLLYMHEWKYYKKYGKCRWEV